MGECGKILCMRIDVNDKRCRYAKATWNGIDVTNLCRMADDEKGVVELLLFHRYPRNHLGHTKSSIVVIEDQGGNEEVATYFLRGDVNITMRDTDGN